MRYVLGVVVVAVLAGGAHAESSITRDKAIRLAHEARELVRVNRWAEACPKFEASLRTEPTLDRRFELADCYVHIGRLVSAWQLYRELVELAERDDDGIRYRRAKRQADELEPRVPKLVLKTPVSRPAGLVVTRDGTPVDSHALGQVIYVDPGTYEIVATAPHFDACKLSVALEEGQVKTVVIPELTATFVSSGGLSRSRKVVTIGAFAAGAASIGAGLLFGWKASSAYSDAQKLCGPELACAPTDYDRGKELAANARWRANASTMFIVVGGAAIIAGVAVRLTAPHNQESATAQIVPVASDRGAGLALTGRF